MRVSIENVAASLDNVWVSTIEPQKLLKLTNPLNQSGTINVVMVTNPKFSSQRDSLQFDLDSVQLLNLGNSTHTVFINSKNSIVSNLRDIKETDATEQSMGDKLFLEELCNLPDVQKNIGVKLLTIIRQNYPGELIYHHKSGKYVESPDNFWVVRIQPRAKSLRIIVYGKPEEYSELENIQIKPDMTGYSNFLISDEKQLLEATKIILRAKNLKDNK